MTTRSPRSSPPCGRTATASRRSSGFPRTGRPREEVLAELEAMAAAERPRWQDGHASGAVYHGDPEHVEFLNRVYALQSQSNPLHVDLWPSATKFEAEIVAMTAALLGGEPRRSAAWSPPAAPSRSCSRSRRTATAPGIERPQMVAARRPRTRRSTRPRSCFGVEAVTCRSGPDFRADVARDRGRDHRPHDRSSSARRRLSARRDRPDRRAVASSRASAASASTPTPAWAASCCRSPSGSATRSSRSTSACPASSSMSADTHKYGYAAKGTSVVLYRGAELRHAQYFTFTEWPGGLYMTPTFAGSRPGRAERGVLGGDDVDRRGRLPRRGAAASSRPPARIRAGIEDDRRPARARRPAVLHRVRDRGRRARRSTA